MLGESRRVPNENSVRPVADVIPQANCKLRRGDEMLLAPPVGGAERRLLLLPRARGRHEDDTLDARPHGRVDGSDMLRPALSGFRIDGPDDDQTIETRIGLRQGFRAGCSPRIVPEAVQRRSRACA